MIKFSIFAALLLVFSTPIWAEELPEGKEEKATKFEPKDQVGQSPEQKEEEDRYIIGYLETVRIPELGMKLKAKLDTGAKTSSINAEIVDLRNATKEDEKIISEEGEAEGGDEEIEEEVTPKDNYGSIIFTITDSKGKKKTLERQIVRWAKIKKKSQGYIRRPVVEMEFCLAGLLIHDEVNLSAREHFNYPVLIGRNMLTTGKIAVDPSKVFSAKPNCKKAKTENESPEEKI